MTYKKAEKIEIGDSIRSKDGYTFTVNRIEETTNAANTEKYIVLIVGNPYFLPNLHNTQPQCIFPLEY